MHHRPVRSALPLLGLAALLPLSSGLAQDATPAAAGGVGVVAEYAFPELPLAALQGETLPEAPIGDDRGFLLGGVGSDLWHDPAGPADEFWMVTDRGPNAEVEVGGEERRAFPVPEFTPLILRVVADNGELSVEEAIPLVGGSGAPVTGLSNLEGVDEAPFDFSGEEALPYNPSGLDTEGLVRTSAGDFWLVDEYSPSLVHVDPSGRVLARYVPEGLALEGADYPVVDNLPAIFAERKANRGFEGLAFGPDQRTLYLTLQSPLANPDGDTGEASRAGRILAFDIEAERPAAEYLYRFEVGPEFDPAPEVDQDEMKLSGVVALGPTTLLVLERTDEVARLYRADLAAATDILGSAWDDPASSPSLESLPDPEAEGVVPLAKTLAVDLEAVPGMPDKIEGVAVLDPTTVAVANDNDFDVGGFDEAGRHRGEGLGSRLLVLRTAPLPGAAGVAATPVPSAAATPIVAAEPVVGKGFE